MPSCCPLASAGQQQQQHSRSPLALHANANPPVGFAHVYNIQPYAASAHRA